MKIVSKRHPDKAVVDSGLSFTMGGSTVTFTIPNVKFTGEFLQAVEPNWVYGEYTLDAPTPKLPTAQEMKAMIDARPSLINTAKIRILETF